VSLSINAVRAALDDFLGDELYPCVVAKSVNQRDTIKLLVARDITRPLDDVELYDALCQFGAAAVADGGSVGSADTGFQTLIIAYAGPATLTESEFEAALWNRLQNLHNFDAVRGEEWDPAVNADPESAHFSMSIGGYAFFVVGLHPNASRPARRFAYPSLVFNLHVQFELMRQDGRYDRVQSAIRERDTALSGSVNPMLANFGDGSEAAQYSGRQVDAGWRCPLEPKTSALPDDHDT
jgi:FPC/CPF motif-containing protein YcgG